jgi:hypothetical protein
MSGDELHQFGADVRGDMDAVKIGGDAGGCEFGRMSPSQGRPGQRAVCIEDRHAQRPVAATSSSQELGNLGILLSEALDGLTPEARVPVEGLRRNAADQPGRQRRSVKKLSLAPGSRQPKQGQQ